MQFDLIGQSATIVAQAIDLPPPIGRLGPVTVDCPRLQIDSGTLACEDARIRARVPALGADDNPEFSLAFSYERRSGELNLLLSGVRWGETAIDLHASVAGDTWHLEIEAPALTMATQDGTLATDALAAKLLADLTPGSGDWGFEVHLSLPRGQIYLDPVFLDLDDAPLEIHAAGRWSASEGIIAIESLRLDHAGILRAGGRATYRLADEAGLQAADIRLEHVDVAGAYPRWLQPFLIGTPLDDLATSGRLEGGFELAAEGLQRLDLWLEQLSAEDREGRFDLVGIQGEVHWQAGVPATGETDIRWRRGSAWRIGLGPTRIRARTGGDELVILEPVRVPILDGALNIARLEINNPGTPELNLVFDGSLEPVGMESLSRALGWPVFGGTVSGSVPDLVYRDGRLRVGGALSAEVFDGRIDVEGLELGTPFGARPTLMADVRMRGLDLEQLTRAFSFGRIEGRLHGDLEGLRLLDWSPVAVDARFYTPPGDRSRHRISQRAVEALAEVGGSGAAAVLSRGFLRFFDDFAYDRIGIGCLLENGVCRMSGLEPHPEGGYYIVKGRLLPRIDVVGHARDVDWDALVRQLAEATRSGGPVVR